jgi:dihydroorotate dehydrogenase electron transfer subunit
MIQQNANILWNRPAGPACFRMGLSCPQGYEAAAAGQFVMVRSNAGLTPLLRRPFSIFGLIGSPEHPEGIELLYKVVGDGTRHMADMVPGQTLDLLGPLGRGFRVPDAIQKVYLTAGGMGVAPIRYLAQQLSHRKVVTDLHLFLGGRSQEDLLCRDDFRSMGIPVTATTDDGSMGRQCLVTDPLSEAIAENRPDIVFACGPPGMLQCIAGIAEHHALACQVSLETMMACGMGACLGCAVPKADQQGYHHVCVDGPVFEVGQVNLPLSH